MNTLLTILAQATGDGSTPASPTGSQPGPLFQIISGPFFPIMLVLVVLWIIMLRGQRKQKRHREQMLETLKKNDRIETIGGLLGTVVEVRDGEVLVKADETNNTKLRFRRSAIHRVIVEEEKK